MYIQAVKCASIAVLLVAIFFGNSPPLYQVALTLAVTVGAILVLIQAFQAKRYWWAVGFLAVAILFNPALPAVRLSDAIGSSLVVLSIVPFAISLVALKPHRLLSIPSITDRTPGSESL
jgi:hypothetical protein